MTATGPDKGTPEYYNATHSAIFKPWLIQESFIRLFADATGPLPKRFDKRKLTGNHASYILPYLLNLQTESIYENLLTAYETGSITPELREILEEEPPRKTPEELEGKEKYSIIAKMMQEGKLNFEPFRTEKDVELNWPFFYRLDFSPLPNITTSIKDIKYLIDLSQKLFKSQIKNFVINTLEGEKDHISLFYGNDTPPTAEDFIAFTNLIEKQYKARISENTPLNWTAQFLNMTAGFYINPETCIIKDLRPHTAEINALLSLKSWDYLLEAVNIIREALREFTEPVKEEAGTGEGILQSLFPDVYYGATEGTKNFRNLPVSKAEKRLIPAYASARISGQGITLKDSEGNPLQEVDFIDASGKISEETIQPFDVSIMNCVGSLQQKYPDQKGFTDIQIAKEFCSTQDKKGHITPESPIVKDVRESMRRLRVVFGKIDITEQIKKEAGRRHPNQKKIDTLMKGSKRFSIAQPLVNIKNIAVQTLKNDKDTLLYIIEGAPLFYLHAAITHQIAPVPYEQMNSKKNLTTEIRLLREQTRIAIETAISMRARGIGGERIRFNSILDATFRTSADEPEDPAKVEMTEVVSRIQEQKRWKLQRQILQYLDELITHGFITSYTVLKKKLPGKKKLVEYAFTFTLPEGETSYPQTANNYPPNCK